ncbi:MAG: hypothetical protein AAF349_16715, partial [Cyanobacteria bacterium P01_A01_bin.68]
FARVETPLVAHALAFQTFRGTRDVGVDKNLTKIYLMKFIRFTYLTGTSIYDRLLQRFDNL